MFFTPINAMALNAALTMCYVVVGEFSTLITFYGVAGYTFYFSTVLGLIVLRVREPGLGAAVQDLDPRRPSSSAASACSCSRAPSSRSRSRRSSSSCSCSRGCLFTFGGSTGGTLGGARRVWIGSFGGDGGGHRGLDVR